MTGTQMYSVQCTVYQTWFPLMCFSLLQINDSFKKFGISDSDSDVLVVVITSDKALEKVCLHKWYSTCMWIRICYFPTGRSVETLPKAQQGPYIQYLRHLVFLCRPLSQYHSAQAWSNIKITYTKLSFRVLVQSIPITCSTIIKKILFCKVLYDGQASLAHSIHLQFTKPAAKKSLQISNWWAVHNTSVFDSQNW